MESKKKNNNIILIINIKNLLYNRTPLNVIPKRRDVTHKKKQKNKQITEI